MKTRGKIQADTQALIAADVEYAPPKSKIT